MGDLNNRSDEDLMMLYQSGDYAAFECLYTRHSGRVFQYLGNKVSSEVAKDLIQEVFLKVHRSRNTYQSQYPFLPWLFTIARNALNDFFKSSEQNVAKIDIDSIPLTEPLVHVTSEHDLSVALNGLPHLQRQAIELRYLNEWSFEKIALEMKTTPENARQIISRGIRKVRSLFKGDKK